MTKRATSPWNCRHCHKRPRDRLKPLLARWQKRRYLPDKIDQLVCEYIRDLCGTHDPAESSIFVTKERIALRLNVREHEVAQSLHRLNLAGIVAQPRHVPPHDSKRDPWTPGGDHSWQGDLYDVLKVPRG